MSSVFLVRHGQASFGASNYDELSAAGITQARLLAGHWRSLGIALDAVYCGTLRRQVDTARVLLDRYAADGIAMPEPIIDPAFNEYSFQPLLMAHALRTTGSEHPDWARFKADQRAFYAFFEDAVLAWTRGEIDAGGESWPAFQARCVDGLERVFGALGRGQAVAVFSSGGPIGVMVQRLLDLSDVATIRLKFTLYNAAVSQVLHDGNRATLTSFNTVAHLEHPDRRHLLTNR
jgi:broad specificity phosphatase PhoE